MRKMILMVLLVCAGMAQAGEYAYLVFTNTEGTKTALSVTDLKMTVNGAQLDVINADGTVQFTLTELAAKGMKSEGDMYISGGTINVTTSGGGVWDATNVKANLDG